MAEKYPGSPDMDPKNYHSMAIICRPQGALLEGFCEAC